MQASRDAMDVFMLLDIGYKGRFWKFEKKVAGGSFAGCRLDRSLGSAQLMARFPTDATSAMGRLSSCGKCIMDGGMF